MPKNKHEIVKNFEIRRDENGELRVNAAVLPDDCEIELSANEGTGRHWLSISYAGQHRLFSFHLIRQIWCEDNRLLFLLENAGATIQSIQTASLTFNNENDTFKVYTALRFLLIKMR